jgi:hypothetical protein
VDEVTRVCEADHGQFGERRVLWYPELESIRLLFEVMTDPTRYNNVLESFFARVTCRLGWGTTAAAEELKQRARELLIGVSPAESLAKKFPFIMSLPESWTKSKAWELRRRRTEQKFFKILQDDVPWTDQPVREGP